MKGIKHLLDNSNHIMPRRKYDVEMGSSGVLHSNRSHDAVRSEIEEKRTSTIYYFVIWASMRKSLWFGNNKGADQPAHPCSLISAFVIRLLEIIISRLATNEISFFYLVSVAEQAGLSLPLSETPKTGFIATRQI